MKTHQVLTRKALARAAVVGISTGFAALALACPASADHALLDKTINVPDCQASNEKCSVVPSFTFFTPESQVKVTFIADGGCSTITAHIVIDGNDNYTGLPVAPNQSNEFDTYLDPGFHKISERAEGDLLAGGCNTGRLAFYSGRLLVDSIED
jgi:hypothetical protein